jgi:hypothetical protein
MCNASNSAVSSVFFQRTSLAVVFLCLVLASFAAAQNAPPAPDNMIPQGTVALIQLTDKLDTHTVKAGDHFHARLVDPLVAGNGSAIEEGKKISGHVSAVEPGLHTRLILSFDEIETSKGWKPLIATVTGVPGEHGLQQIGDEGQIGRKGMSKEEIAEAVVVGAGEGADEGLKNGGKRGAATGAGSGAASGALSAFESSHDLVLEKGTALEIRLDRNLTIAAR